MSDCPLNEPLENGETIFQDAIKFLMVGQLSDAERLLNKLLECQPKHIGGLNLLTIVLMGMQRNEEAERIAKLAIAVSHNSSVTFYNYGLILKSLNRLDDALLQFNKSLELDGAVAETWNNRGTIFNDLKQFDHAIPDFEKSISLKPDYAEAFYNKGKSLTELRRYDEALVSFREALALKPDLAEAWLGRGNILVSLARYDEAIDSYGKATAINPHLSEAWYRRGDLLVTLNRYSDAISAYGRALAIRPEFADAWCGRGNAFALLKRYAEAFANYDKALLISPSLAAAWLGRGNIYTELNLFDEALAVYDKALELNSVSAKSWLGRGNVLHCLKRYDESFAAYDKAQMLDPHLAEVWAGRGMAFSELKQYDKAFVAYDNALKLKPELGQVEGLRLYAKMHMCDWNDFDAECAHLVSSVEHGIDTIPFAFIAISPRPDAQLQCARHFSKTRFPYSDKSVAQTYRYNHDRIRIAYLSGDFRLHPTSSAIVGVFEHHDHNRLETVAVSFGPDDSSEMRARVKRSVDRFIDVRGQSDVDVATLLKAHEIDIVVDLAGYTTYMRTAIMAQRPSPIQVNFLGYPGTMGADFIDYLLADEILIPKSLQRFYDEKIVYLPNCYHPTSYTLTGSRSGAETVFTRALLGLPQTGFIFCCFNNNYKITPHVFDCWMQILKHVDGSVLWLLETNEKATSNLRSEASARGVNPERLVFAKRMPLHDHLARLPLADLVLDTLPFNAHTTSVDALWAGVPIITQIGDAFAARVAASLLTTIGLPELITSNPKAYIELAIELATNPKQFAHIKRKLANDRFTAPLFDVPLFARHIEAAYFAMYERYQANLAPDHIYLRN